MISRDFTRQEDWNEYGRERLKQINDNPEDFVIRSAPTHRPIFSDIISTIDNIGNKDILVAGCGRGEFAIYLAAQGACVSAVDVGPTLIKAARIQAQINEVSCKFCVGDIRQLPFRRKRFDYVIAVAVLHHLAETDVVQAVAECANVLRPSGALLAYEPVEDSKTFDLFQSLIPVGEPGSDNYRPSILMRDRWKKYLEERSDRPMTTEELKQAGANLFTGMEFMHYGLFVRLTRLIGGRYEKGLRRLDQFILSKCPPLRKYAQTVLVNYQKDG